MGGGVLHGGGGTVNVNVVDALATQHAAQSANRDQLRAAEATLGLLEPHFGKPASAEYTAALAEAQAVLKALGKKAESLDDVVQWLRQQKIPGLYAERTRIGQNTRAEAGLRSGVEEAKALAAGDAYRDADLQEWALAEARAASNGDHATVAHYERRFGAWHRQRADAEGAEATRLAEAAAQEHSKGVRRDPDMERALLRQRDELLSGSSSNEAAARAHLAEAARLDAAAAAQAAIPPPATESHDIRLERVRQRGTAEATRLYNALVEIATWTADTRIWRALDY